MSKEKRKRVDVAPSKIIKFIFKKRKLVLPEYSPSEGERNGTRDEDAESVPQMVEQKAEPEAKGERAMVVEVGEREEPREPYDVEFPHEEAKGGEAEGEKKMESPKDVGARVDEPEQPHRDVITEVVRLLRRLLRLSKQSV